VTEAGSGEVSTSAEADANVERRPVVGHVAIVGQAMFKKSEIFLRVM
jgi:hypothetical protein